MGRRLHDDHWPRWGATVLRRRREVLGLSREDLAQRTNLVAATIRNLERGKVRRPASTTLRVLCGALSLPMPGEDGLYLSIEDVAADRLCHVVAAALHEFACRRRDAARFAAQIHLPANAAQLRRATATVIAERDLASDLVGLLRPDRDSIALDETTPDPVPNPASKKRSTVVPSFPPHRFARNPARPHG